MGCGASQNDVIKSVVPKNSSDQPIKKRPSVNMNGSSSKSGNGNGSNVDSMNSSLLSESSTIPAGDFYQDQDNPGRDSSSTNDFLKPLPRGLPPLKPPRGTKNGAGFTDQNTNESNEINKNSRIGKKYLNRNATGILIL